MISIGDSDYHVDDGQIQINVRFTAAQAERIAAEATEATSGPEAVRTLVEEALQQRERRVTPATIELATRGATEPIRSDLNTIQLLLRDALDRDGE